MTETMIEPHACDSCGDVYDEANGDGYCGLCPACADRSEPTDWAFVRRIACARSRLDDVGFFGPFERHDDGERIGVVAAMTFGKFRLYVLDDRLDVLSGY